MLVCFCLYFVFRAFIVCKLDEKQGRTKIKAGTLERCIVQIILSQVRVFRTLNLVI